MYLQLLELVKDIKGARFYFVTFLIFLAFLVMTFKDELRQFNFSPKQMREISDTRGLETELNMIRRQHKLTTGYAAYVYQPQAESYYKKLIVTDITTVKGKKYFTQMPLNAQKYLNYLLINKEYVMLASTDTLSKSYTDDYNAEYILVYNVYVKETIAEVMITFDIKPTQQEINDIVKLLKNTKYYII